MVQVDYVQPPAPVDRVAEEVVALRRCTDWLRRTERAVRPTWSLCYRWRERRRRSRMRTAHRAAPGARLGPWAVARYNREWALPPRTSGSATPCPHHAAHIDTPLAIKDPGGLWPVSALPHPPEAVSPPPATPVSSAPAPSPSTPSTATSPRRAATGATTRATSAS